MDQTKLQSILDALPPKTMRSRLEPFRQLILELRVRERSYREIARVLAEHCQVHVAPSTIHDFVRVRVGNKLKKPVGFDTAELTKEVGPAIADSEPLERPAKIDLSQRILAIKERKAPEAKPQPLFTYEEDEPLRLIQRLDNTGRK